MADLQIEEINFLKLCHHALLFLKHREKMYTILKLGRTQENLSEVRLLGKACKKDKRTLGKLKEIK